LVTITVTDKHQVWTNT